MVNDVHDRMAVMTYSKEQLTEEGGKQLLLGKSDADQSFPQANHEFLWMLSRRALNFASRALNLLLIASRICDVQQKKEEDRHYRRRNTRCNVDSF